MNGIRNTITRQTTVCHNNNCDGTFITWHPDPQGSLDFWSCDKCSDVKQIPPPGVPLWPSPDPLAWDDWDELIERAEIDTPEVEVETKCFCLGPPLKDCPIHGEGT